VLLYGGKIPFFFIGHPRFILFLKIKVKVKIHAGRTAAKYIKKTIE
jgi:hypothetical protein